MTVTLAEATEAARQREHLIAGLTELVHWLRANPGSPLPVVHANFRTEGRDAGERLDALADVAAWLDVPVTPADVMGDRYARRHFGPVEAEGHVRLDRMGHDEYMARSAALRAAQAGTGAAA